MKQITMLMLMAGTEALDRCEQTNALPIATVKAIYAAMRAVEPDVQKELDLTDV